MHTIQWFGLAAVLGGLSWLGVICYLSMQPPPEPMNAVVVFTLNDKAIAKVVVAPDKAAVHKHQHATEGPVELHRDPPAQIAGSDLELPPVPAHAGLRIPPPQRFVPVRILFLVAYKWQFHRTVVGQIERPPLAVVELCL